MKKVIAALLTVLIITSAWVTVLTHLNAPTEDSEVKKYIDLAEQQCAAGAYGSAIRLYQRVLSKEDTVRLRLRLAEVWRLYGNGSGYSNELKELIRVYPEDERAHVLLAELYYSNADFRRCCDVITNARTDGVESKVLDEMYRKCAYRYEVLADQFEFAGVFVGERASVQKDGKVFIVNSTLKMINRDGFEFTDAFFGSSAAVKTEEECFFIDKNGEKYMVVDQSYTNLYSYSDGMAAFESSGKFGYIDIFGQKVLGDYAFASTFSHGFAAVCDEKGWYIIDIEGESMMNTRYKSVKLDEKNTIGSGAFCFVYKDGDWIILDTKSWKLGMAKFEDARAPTGDNIAAVRQDGVWGFVDKNGSLLIKPKYEDATSFSCGLAAVKQGGLWGYIDLEGHTVIDFVFEDANRFSDNGMAPVKINGKWKYIKLKYRENLK
jgi:hypothetical protein